MGDRALRLWPDPILSHLCAPVALDDPDLADLITDLFEAMYHAKGRGLAAPQIGVAKRVFVVDVTWKESHPTPRTFINPVIFDQTVAVSIVHEQCLSIPNVSMDVVRPDRIQVQWDTIEGHRRTAMFDGIEARCIQHELDHLNGTVILDHQTPQMRAQLEASYAP